MIHVVHGRERRVHRLLLARQRQLRCCDLSTLRFQSLDCLFLLVVDDTLFLEVFDLQAVFSFCSLDMCRRNGCVMVQSRPLTQLCAQFFSNSLSNCEQKVSAFSRPDFVFMLSRMLFLSRHSKKVSRAS